jgi:hypothetical protein
LLANYWSVRLMPKTGARGLHETVG